MKLSGSIAKVLNKVGSIRPFMDQPIGKAVVYSTAQGLAMGFGGLAITAVGKYGGTSIDASYQGPLGNILVAILFKVKKLANIVTPGFADLVATFAWKQAIALYLGSSNIEGKIQGFIQEQLTNRVFPLKGLASTQGMAAVASTSGMGDIRTVVPYEQGYGAVGSLTALEAKLASIRG